MNHASLFSGIGGFDLASEWMGWNNVLSCEIDAFCNKVLKYHFPNSIHYEDIKKTDFTLHRGGIDILTGGFPCQPFSLAGKRRGTDDDRHLWPEMLRAIREIQPRWIVGENVFGLTNWNGGVVFREVLSDLENEGYEVQPFIIPACAVNAPHRRDRVWIVAHKSESGWSEGIGQETNIQGREMAEFRQERNCLRNNNRTSCQNGDAADTESKGLQRGNGSRKSIRFNEGNKETFTYTDRMQRPEGRMCQEGREGAERYACTRNARTVWGWENFPTQPPLRSRNDGFPGGLDGITVSKLRNESIKAAGNAIVPKVAYEIFKAIQAYENII